MKKRLYFLILFTTVVCINDMTVFAASKISLSPVSSSISEGQSQAITIRLDQPIGSPHSVSIHLSTSNPETVTLSPSTVTYNSSEWAQAKTFTVSAPLNGTSGDTRNVLIVATASSGAPYYNGYTTGINIHINDTTMPGQTYDPNLTPEPEEQTSNEDPTPVDQVEKAPVVPIASSPDAISEETNGIFEPTAVSSSYRSPGSIQVTWPRAATFFIPDSPTLMDKLSAYALLLLLICMAVLTPYLFIKRSSWWRRQKSRHIRWVERHSK